VTNRHADRCHRQDLTELRQLVWIELFHDARTCPQPTRRPAVRADRVGNRSMSGHSRCPCSGTKARRCASSVAAVA
jgi:hypothetical protein